ncbi:2-acylglycerol O-acyltransferase 1 [Asbolus verrucosus]|uniref:2-acylglycerol O-acyltransferase 1 n=1 Tax=Asbolus verrucosus TaxID=1661398 RepID=A0A482VWD3_ASBVE|nr:2-acylglycerol O-acyltransferase 1 [Asbolus verrucosus]
MSPPLELLAATAWFWIFSIGFLISIVTSIIFLLSPSFYWAVVLYAFWIWYDRKTCERGGRPVLWVRQWTWWRYMKNYFSYKLVTDEDVTLDPAKNYLFACFPHGMLPVGTFSAFVDGYQSLFPNHQAFTTVLNIQFWVPVIRELFLSIGAVSVSGPSIKHLLSEEKGGNIVSILIGGADESKYSQPGKYKIILNKRKGFIKMALQTGSPLVPVMTFGETDVFDQLDFPGLQFVRNLVKNVLQIGLVIPIGTYLICPNRVPVVTVVGNPINVTKVEKPTTEEIDALHQQFVDSITKLFESHKHKYVKDPAKTMQILGIQFAPLRVPLERRFQTLAAASWFATLAFGGFVALFLSLYLLFTRLWWLMSIYLGWMYLDRHVCERGGRPLNWVQSWKWWWYFRDYFPLHLAAVPEAKLDPKRNYLFCAFPHGVLSTGVFNAFSSNASEFHQLFPDHDARVATLHQHYFMPFFRDFALSIRGISASADSINYVLSRPEGGKIVVLMPGGAAESYFSRPGQYKVLVKRRKGFVKLALKNGTPVVPVLSFGETDLFDQVEGPTIRRFQEFVRKFLGMAPLLFIGRGFFQYSFGIIPQRREVTTLGKIHDIHY